MAGKVVNSGTRLRTGNHPGLTGNGFENRHKSYTQTVVANLKERMEKIEWQKIEKIVFRHKLDSSDTLEDFHLTRRKEHKFRVRVGVVQINNGALGSFSIKEILIFFGFRKVGIVGTGVQSNRRKVKCPYCRYVQGLKEEYQLCENCNKKFYLYDDNW